MDTLHQDISRIIVSSHAIHNRIIKLAEQINQDYNDVEQLLVLGILRGAFIFMADLTRHLSIPHVVDFMALTSYRKNSFMGEVRILMDSRESMRNQHILIIEDILDSGSTINYLCRTIKERQPASLRTCVLVRKKREHDLQVDYVGFDIPDVWVVGYGLDYDNRYRTLPYIGELKIESTSE